MASSIYLDANATTPIHPTVLTAMEKASIEAWANPSSDHALGLVAKSTIERSRESVASLIHASADDVIFTSGATEALNLAIQGTIRACTRNSVHVVTTAVEHDAVLATLHDLCDRSCVSLTVVSPDPDGCVSVKSILNALTAETRLVCVIHANNEIGSINPIKAIGEELGRRDIRFLVDAAQSCGYFAPDVNECHIDFLALSAHKMHGPKGIGALFMRSGTPLAPLQFGGGQEAGYRPGTQNVIGIAGMGVAAELAAQNGARRTDTVSNLRDVFLDRLRDRVPSLRLNGHPVNRLPGNLSLTVPYVNARMLQKLLPSLAFTRGSACSEQSVDISHVLAAVGLSGDEASWTFRIGLSEVNSMEEVLEAVELLADKIEELNPI